MVLPVAIVLPVAVVLCALGLPVGLYLARPGLLVKLYMKFGLLVAGLKTKFTGNEEITFCYAERGVPNKEKPSLLFIHGFTASKDMWSAIIKKLPSDLHAIVFDLPGHGDTVSTVNEDMSFTGQAKRVHQFVELVGLNRGFSKYHVIGQSMGGAISAIYAATYPEEVALVTLICPAMDTPEVSDFAKHIAETGKVALLPDTVDEIIEMMTFVVHKPIKFPKQIMKGALELRRPRMEYFNKLFVALVEEKDVINNNMSRITVPTQVIWGVYDRLIHVSGAKVLREGLGNCYRCDLIPECGHSTNMERPGTVTKLLLQFRKLEKQFDSLDSPADSAEEDAVNTMSANQAKDTDQLTKDIKASL